MNHSGNLITTASHRPEGTKCGSQGLRSRRNPWFPPHKLTALKAAEETRSNPRQTHVPKPPKLVHHFPASAIRRKNFSSGSAFAKSLFRRSEIGFNQILLPLYFPFKSLPVTSIALCRPEGSRDRKLSKFADSLDTHPHSPAPGPPLSQIFSGRSLPTYSRLRSFAASHKHLPLYRTSPPQIEPSAKKCTPTNKTPPAASKPLSVSCRRTCHE